MSHNNVYMEEKILKKFAKKVAELRFQKGWSQEELGRRSGLHRTYIGSIERKERNVSLVNVEKIAKALGVNPKELIG
jgi:transcriptional regulator with XRE-family HTH domain